MKRRLLYIFAAAFVLYLIGSGVVAWYVESEYMTDLRLEVRGLGRDSFRQPDKLRFSLMRDPKLQHLRSILDFDLPFGWIELRRVNLADQEVFFAARNFALPADQRFANPDEARHLGFDPSRRDDDSIAEELMNDLK